MCKKYILIYVYLDVCITLLLFFVIKLKLFIRYNKNIERIVCDRLKIDNCKPCFRTNFKREQRL